MSTPQDPPLSINTAFSSGDWIDIALDAIENYRPNPELVRKVTEAMNYWQGDAAAEQI